MSLEVDSAYVYFKGQGIMIMMSHARRFQSWLTQERLSCTQLLNYLDWHGPLLLCLDANCFQFAHLLKEL